MTPRVSNQSFDNRCQATGLRRSRANGKDNGAFVLTISGASASGLKLETPLRLQIDYDLTVARDKMAETLSRIKPYVAAYYSQAHPVPRDGACLPSKEQF